MTVERPSIVLILTDTQGADIVGTYNPDAGVRTPCLDGLARSGTHFERAYTAAPVCTPARATLMTGLNPATSGAWANNAALAAEALTLGQHLQSVGYRTAYVGKWHLDGTNYYGSGTCPPGWELDYWYDGRRYSDELGDERFRLWRSGLRSVDDLRKHDITAEFTMGNRVTERALRFLDRQPSGQPFLLVVSYDEPHEPFTCPPEHAEAFRDHWFPLGPAAADTLAGKPEHQHDWATDSHDPRGLSRHWWGQQYGGQLRNGHFRHPLYFGCNSFVDAEIGRLVDAVRYHHGDHTVIMHTSDHGTMKGAHRLLDKGPAMYEELVRVPLIIAGPPELVPTGTVAEPVSHYDVAPTILNLADIPIPGAMSGRSLLSSLGGLPVAGPARPVFIQYNQFSRARRPSAPYRDRLFPIRAVIRDGWKLIVNAHGHDELYHLDTDSGEVHNSLAEADSDAAAVAELLLQLILDHMDETKDPFRGPEWSNRPWRRVRS